MLRSRKVYSTSFISPFVLELVGGCKKHIGLRLDAANFHRDFLVARLDVGYNYIKLVQPDKVRGQALERGPRQPSSRYGGH